jgi:hypothetical protein
MKYLFFLPISFFALVATAQTKVYQQAQVSTTVNVIAPEEESVENIQGGGEFRGGMNFRNMLDGETKFVTYLKADKIKTTMKSEMGRSAVYRDNTQKSTTTVIEMMGSKNGFVITDEEQADMQRKRDSMMALRRNRDSSAKPLNTEKLNPTTDISYTSETKKIAGFNCKKGYLITNRLLGIKDSTAFWYCPEFKLENVSYTGSLNNIPMMSNMAPNLNGFEKVEGFVMAYETKMRRNRTIQVEVTKVETDKKIEDKEFEIPKDIEIKPMKEMQNMFRGGGGNGGFRGGRD